MAIILALGFMGNMVQSNSIGSSFETAFGIKPYVMGILVAVVAAVIFLGGINRIARVTEKIVPIMALIYIVGCGIILIMNLKGLGTAFHDIFVAAFSPSAVLGGAAGVTVQKAMRFGVARGLFSNEAGMGYTSCSCHGRCKAPGRPGNYCYDWCVYRYLYYPYPDGFGDFIYRGFVHRRDRLCPGSGCFNSAYGYSEMYSLLSACCFLLLPPLLAGIISEK